MCREREREKRENMSRRIGEWEYFKSVADSQLEWQEKEAGIERGIDARSNLQNLFLSCSLFPFYISSHTHTNTHIHASVHKHSHTCIHKHTYPQAIAHTHAAHTQK